MLSSDRSRYVFKVSYLKDSNESPESEADNSRNKEETTFGLGVTGVDRITNPSSSLKLKTFWIICFLSFTFASVYQIRDCINEFSYGKPNIAVEMVLKDTFTMPTMVFCPGYYFSFLRTLKVTEIEEIWNDQLMELQFKLQCTTTKNDFSCLDSKQNFSVENVKTAGGRCLKTPNNFEMRVFGPVSLITTDSKYLMFSIFPTKIFFPIEGESTFYANIDEAHTAARNVLKISLEFIEVTRMNLSHSRCETIEVVEKCVDKCTEELLYSQVNCRLPFMRNESISFCQTSNAYQDAVNILRNVIKQRKECRKQCPKKCFEKLMIYSFDVANKIFQHTKCFFMIFNKHVLSVQEEPWYTVSSLIADISSILGFFLDISFSTIPEIIEVIIPTIKQTFQRIFWKNKLLQFKNFLKSSFTRRSASGTNKVESPNIIEQPINISITGCDRLLNEKTSSFRKTVWFMTILFCICLCSYQIYDTMYDYFEGDPGVKLLIERNETIQVPALTVCPYKPYQFWNFVNDMRKEYARKFNISEKDKATIKTSDLMKLKDQRILSFWNISGVHKGLVKMIAIEGGNQRSPIPNGTSLNEIATTEGKCTSVVLKPIIFIGSATRVLYLFSFPKGESLTSPREGTSSYPFRVYFHSQEDDPRTLDPNTFMLFQKLSSGTWTVHITKVERISRRNKPCSDEVTVAKCRSECYDKKLQEKAPCRLPFMKTMSLPLCKTPEGFNTTMELSYEIMKNYSENNWCNCPLKCSTYIYSIYPDIATGPNFSIENHLQIPSNIIKIPYYMWGNVIFAY